MSADHLPLGTTLDYLPPTSQVGTTSSEVCTFVGDKDNIIIGIIVVMMPSYLFCSCFCFNLLLGSVLGGHRDGLIGQASCSESLRKIVYVAIDRQRSPDMIEDP